MTVLATALVLSFPTGAGATAIGPGFDSFVTDPGAFVDLTGLGLGVIDVEGVPFGPNPFGPPGADTIVQRLDGIDPFNVCPTLPCSGTIDIELVALQLRSVDPVDLTPLGGPFVGVFADLWATINTIGLLGVPVYDVLQPSIGQMQIDHTILSGGTFQSCFGETTDPVGVCGSLGVPNGGVFADGIAVVVGGDPNNPLDILFNLPAPKVAVSAIAGTWSHDGSPDDFRVESIVHVGPHPVSAAVPEPSTALLVACGIIGLVMRWRRLH
jgi:hypothetical protein